MEHKEILPAIDMLMHHAGKSFKEACDELGLDEKEVRESTGRDIASELFPSE